MLSRDQVELIQQEIDGANTPEGSAAVRSLMEQDPEARAMVAELRRVAGLFEQVAEREPPARLKWAILAALPQPARASPGALRSEEHTSELQSRRDLVCRLLLEKKKKN